MDIQNDVMCTELKRYNIEVNKIDDIKYVGFKRRSQAARHASGLRNEANSECATT